MLKSIERVGLAGAKPASGYYAGFTAAIEAVAIAFNCPGWEDVTVPGWAEVIEPDAADRWGLPPLVARPALEG